MKDVATKVRDKSGIVPTIVSLSKSTEFYQDGGTGTVFLRSVKRNRYRVTERRI